MKPLRDEEVILPVNDEALPIRFEFVAFGALSLDLCPSFSKHYKVVVSTTCLCAIALK